MELYIIESGANCKIGVTANLDRRLTGFATHNPDFRVAHTLTLPDEQTARRVETAVRKQLSSSQVGEGREWFAVPTQTMLGAVLQALCPIPPAASIGLQHVELTDRAHVLREQLAASPTPELRATFAQHFAEVFGVGVHRSVIDMLEPRPRRIGPGVDHSAAIAGQCHVNADRRSVDFPGQDHVQYFYDLLPLAGGSHVAYCTAVASMPYRDRGTGLLPELQRSIAYAAGIGWTCTVHPEWTWRHPETRLVLYQRSQSRAQLRLQWEHSLQKWLNEHEKWVESDLMRIGMLPYATWVSDIAMDQHLPLDVTTEQAFMERYWEPFVVRTFDKTDLEIRSAIKALITLWQDRPSCK